ncbi:hypothetical protein N0V82_004169 [Gnomoniopsis sp. IMI 355080]|nr:hypothetical protein N0V82_004169 [Gnomoniopsis sp. IMI 355080]
MFTKTHLALLASAILSANGVQAAYHRHGDRHIHPNDLDKRATIPATTTTVTDVTWVTVTVGEGETTVVPTPTSTSSSSFSSSSVASTSSSALPSTTSSSTSSTYVAPAPTTLITSAVATPDVNIAATPEPSTTESSTTTSDIISQIASVVTSAAAAVTSAASTVTSSSGNKRGAAYNDASLISPLLGTDSKLSWAYNWGSSSDGLSDVSSSLEFVPMLWGEKTVSYWATNAQAAIDAGSKYLLGPNEPDNAAQANMDPATAATFHITNMEPFASKATLGAPSITNSNVAGESVDWLKEWIEACDGQCTFDFCPAHWYNTIEAGAEDLFSFLSEVSAACGTGKTVWLTEFAPNVDSPSDAEISEFLTTVQDTLDNNSTYSFVERYSYFYVADGLLVSGGAASSYGNTFAFS